MLSVSLRVLFLIVLFVVSSFAQTTWNIHLDDYPDNLPPKGGSSNKQEFLRMNAPDGSRAVEKKPWEVNWNWRFNGEKMPTSAADFESRLDKGWVQPNRIGSGDMRISGYKAFYYEAEGLQPSPNYTPQYHSFVRNVVVILSDTELVRINMTSNFGGATDDSHREELRRMVSEFFQSIKISGTKAGSSANSSDNDPDVDADNQPLLPGSTPRTDPSRSRSDDPKSSANKPNSGSTSRTPDRDEASADLPACCSGMALFIGLTMFLTNSTGRRRESAQD